MLYNCGKIFLKLSFFVAYILSFGLVRLRTIWLSARKRAHIEYSSRSRVEDVTITHVIIKSPDRKLNWGVNDVMPGSDGRGFMEILQLVEIRTWARPVELWSARCAARLLSQWVEILTLGREFSWEVDWRAKKKQSAQ